MLTSTRALNSIWNPRLAPPRGSKPARLGRAAGLRITVVLLGLITLTSTLATTPTHAQLPPPPPLPEPSASSECPTCTGRLKKRIAVMPVHVGALSAGLNLSPTSVGSMVRSALEARLAPMPGMLVVSRADLADVVTEQRLAGTARFNTELAPSASKLIPAQVLLYLTVESLAFQRSSAESVVTEADRYLDHADDLERQAASNRRNALISSQRLTREAGRDVGRPGVDCGQRYNCSAETDPARIRWCQDLYATCQRSNDQRAQFFELDRNRALDDRQRQIEQQQLTSGSLEDQARRLRRQAEQAPTQVRREVRRTATLELSWRAVDTATGQVVRSGRVAKSQAQSNRTSAMRAGLQSNQNSEVQATEQLVKNILNLAMLDLAHDVDRTVADAPFRAKVVQVDGDLVAINAGTNLGVSTGDTFGVLDPTTLLTDPVTGELLEAPGRPAGLIEVVRVADRVAWAKIVRQVAALQRGGDLEWLGRRE